MMKYVGFCLAVFMAWFATAGAAVAQAKFPDRPIRVVLPFPPGGAVDLIARLVTAKISEQRGWAFIVESRAGAGGVIATEAVAKATPDGYTLLLTTPNHTINAALKSKLPYDTERDLVPISVVAEVPMLLVSHPAAPFKTFKELVAHAKANPRQLNYSSAGNGTLPHISMELMMKLAGIEVVHVPYRGAAPALTDLIGGVVQLKYDTYATSRELVAAGRLRALAFASAARSSLMPDVPTIAELGFPGYEGVLWNALMAPAGVPKPIIELMQAASAEAVRTPALVSRLRQDGIEPVGGASAVLGKRIATEIQQWRELARSAKLAIE